LLNLNNNLTIVNLKKDAFTKASFLFCLVFGAFFEVDCILF